MAVAKGKDKDPEDRPVVEILKERDITAPDYRTKPDEKPAPVEKPKD